MDREIEFRGLCDEPYLQGRKEWVYGDLLHNAISQGTFIHQKNSTVKVDPNTIGQYTGLTDRNGHKIFEDDVLLVQHVLGYVSEDGRKTWDAISEESEAYVIYDDDAAAFKLIEKLANGREVWNHFPVAHTSDDERIILEVVGNLYDTKHNQEKGGDQ